MASGSHDARKRELSPLEEEYLSSLPRKRTSPSSSENMRKEKKSTQEKLASHKLRTSAGRPVSGPHKVCKVLPCKRRTLHPILNPGNRNRTLPSIGASEMANKENEVAFSGNLQEKLLKDSRTYLLNDPGSSQADGPTSKYSSFFAEVSSDHETMMQVLFSRNLRLSVALTFWRRQAVAELIAYLLRIEDLGVMVDFLPVLTNSVRELKPHVSLGCCIDLQPLVALLIRSRFEEYVVVGLNWLQAVFRRWCLELSCNTEIEDSNTLLFRRNLKDLWEQERHLSFVPGYTGNLAKEVEQCILKLH